MTLVVDASVAIKWMMDEEESEEAVGLLASDSLVAPELIFAEVANTLWRHHTLKHAAAPDIATALAGLDDAIDLGYPLAPLSRRATEIAIAIGHPVYDCYYLALAENLGSQVVTADRKLIAKLAGTPFAGLARALA